MSSEDRFNEVGAREPSCLRAALSYAANGWAVFPVNAVASGRCGCGATDCASPGKHPLTSHGVKQASSDAGTVEAWWRRWPKANVAIATGSVSGVIVIDVDPPEGESSLNRLVGEGHALPETLTARTGSGGIHLYYRAPVVSLGNAAGLGEGEPPIGAVGGDLLRVEIGGAHVIARLRDAVVAGYGELHGRLLCWVRRPRLDPEAVSRARPFGPPRRARSWAILSEFESTAGRR